MQTTSSNIRSRLGQFFCFIPLWQFHVSQFHFSLDPNQKLENSSGELILTFCQTSFEAIRSRVLSFTMALCQTSFEAIMARKLSFTVG